MVSGFNGFHFSGLPCSIKFCWNDGTIMAVAITLKGFVKSIPRFNKSWVNNSLLFVKSVISIAIDSIYQVLYPEFRKSLNRVVFIRGNVDLLLCAGPVVGAVSGSVIDAFPS